MSQVEARQLRGENYKPLAPSDLFELVDVTQDPLQTDPKITYKSKLRVTLQNSSLQHIDAKKPDWISSDGYVPFQAGPGIWSVLQAPKAMGGWDDEKPMLHLPPGCSFRASVGLDDGFSVQEINRRHATEHVGLLIIPVTVDGIEMEWRVRL